MTLEQLKSEAREKVFPVNTDPNDAWHTAIYERKIKDLDTLITTAYNAGLEAERQKREEVVKETLEEAGNYVDELYQSGNMGENEFELLTEFFDEKLTQPNN